MLRSLPDKMSCLVAFLSSHPDGGGNQADPSVESYPFYELHPVHTYPPPAQPAATSASTLTYPTESALNEDFVMSLYNPWEVVCRTRDDKDCVSLAIFVLVSQLTNI
jgi:hypothetical protein